MRSLSLSHLSLTTTPYPCTTRVPPHATQRNATQRSACDATDLDGAQHAGTSQHHQSDQLKQQDLSVEASSLCRDEWYVASPFSFTTPHPFLLRLPPASSCSLHPRLYLVNQSRRERGGALPQVGSWGTALQCSQWRRVDSFS